jgi:hypothetical protein
MVKEEMADPQNHCEHECFYKRDILNERCGIPRCQHDTRTLQTTVSFPVDVPITINKATGEFDIDLTEHNAVIISKAREEWEKEHTPTFHAEHPNEFSPWYNVEMVAARVRKAREGVLEEQDDQLFRIERLAYECTLNHPESKGFCSEIQTIAKSLRHTEQPKKQETNYENQD